MAIESPHKDYRLVQGPGGAVGWLETLLLTVMAVALGLWWSPHDPLQAYGFPWSILAPLLVGLRYGFVKAVVSAGMLAGAVLLLHRYGHPSYPVLPSAYIVGMLVSAMVAGEFRDVWVRRLQKLQMANEYRQYRLDEFTRSHQLLRLSHDRLEQRVAGGEQSLRSSLLLLRDQLRQVGQTAGVLEYMAEAILGLIGQYGSLRVAGLYRLSAQRVDPQPLASLGEMGRLDPDDKLVRLCLTRGELVSVRDIYSEHQTQGFSSLKVCVPLIDADGRMLAILAVRNMPFFAFNDRTLSLLALLAGHVADLLSSDAPSLALQDPDAQFFSQQLKRSLHDAQQHQLDATVFAMELLEPSEELTRAFTESQRGLDLQLQVVNQRGHQCLLALLPLTAAEGARSYVDRLCALLDKQPDQGEALDGYPVRLRHYQLDPSGRPDALRKFLYLDCGLTDDQVAI